jgi:NADPH:quinone reductase-like Zn-dependent oxidoreductase
VSRRVQLDRYGDAGVLHIADVPVPEPGVGQLVIQVLAAGINPGEIAVREGAMEQMFPATFPSGQGSDFAGRVASAGPGVTGFAVGDEVLGWSDSRSAQADFVLTDPGHLARKPLALDWVRAGSLWAAGVTSLAAVRAVSLHPGDVVAVSAAAGGVGAFAVQLARRAGARVLGVASERNADWLRSVGVEPLAYGSGLAGRLSNAAPGGVDAFIDTHGGGYVQLAVSLGVSPERIDTIIDFAGAAKFGAKTEASPEASTPTVLAAMADHVAWGRLVMPVAAVYPLERVREAYAELAEGHAHGKIVLSTVLPADAKALRPT